MRFACVEYTTKTGAMWRHTPERPNYLADPEKEIDPTSFGCYTSAFEGVHVPLSGLIYESLTKPPSAFRRLRQDLTRTRTGAFASYDLSLLASLDVLLVIYQMSNDDELVRFVQRVRKEFPDLILVSSSSPPFGRLREHWKDHPDAITRYQAFINATHMNMNVCRATVPYYTHLVETPSLYLPQPYPVEYAISRVGTASELAPPTLLRMSRWGPRRSPPMLPPPARGVARPGPDYPRPRDRETISSSRPIIYVSGDTVRPDILAGHLVARELQKRHPDMLIRITKTPEFSLNTALLEGAGYEVVPFRPWAEQLVELATVRLVLNTDMWWTRGRVQVDCAAAGVPCVGTTSDGQTELWPELTAPHSTDIAALLALSERALTDEAFRASAIRTAQRRLAHYAYEPTVERFTRAVDSVRTGQRADWHDPIWEHDALTLPTP
ncbi:MAG: hypothetical protein G01um1014106_484 [Parcubacteria group bacterium Gr01-1014_106]|nr:MAG: hypothetical protein G01um1014106_484 [Parcubacteria group bacterium Gr01-1014_106]